MIKNLNALQDKVKELEAMIAGRDAEIDILHAMYDQLEERLTRVEQDQFEMENDLNEGC